MNPFTQLISILVGLYITVILLRFFLQYFRADFYNPLSQFSVKATDPLIKPLRKIVPGLGGIDVSSLILGYFFGLILVLINPYYHNLGPGLFLVMGVIELIQNILNFFIFIIIARVILSWVAPGGYNPVFAVLGQISEPVVGPFRRMLPPMVGFDFSPMITLLLLFFTSQSINYWVIPLIKQLA